MGLFGCDDYRNEVSKLKKELQELQVDLSWYVNQYGVRKNKSSVNYTLKGGSRKRKTKRTKQRSRRSRV